MEWSWRASRPNWYYVRGKTLHERNSYLPQRAWALDVNFYPISRSPRTSSDAVTLSPSSSVLALQDSFSFDGHVTFVLITANPGSWFRWSVNTCHTRTSHLAMSNRSRELSREWSRASSRQNPPTTATSRSRTSIHSFPLELMLHGSLGVHEHNIVWYERILIYVT